MPETKIYLGDSVYVRIEGDCIVLTTENGLPTDPSNTIFLDASAWAKLVTWVDGLNK